MLRRTPLERRTPLATAPEKIRAFHRQAIENSTHTRRPISPASRAQRLAVKSRPCLVCGGAPVDPAHLIDRSLLSEGQDDVRAVVPLCRRCHDLYDAHELDLLPYLEPLFRVELAFAVERFGLLNTLIRVSGEEWCPVERAA